MRIGALLLALAAVLVVGEAHSSKFLPAVRASLQLGSRLLRHVAAVKDRLREDVERHLLRHVEHRPGHEFVFELPSWKKPMLPRPWTSPAFHSSFSYQASSSGLHMLPLPFFPRPMPAIVVVPCRNVKTHIAHFVLPCIRITGEFGRPASGLGASQPNNVTQETSNVTVDDTTSDLAPRAPTSTMTYGTDAEEQYVTGVATRAVDVTENSSTTTYSTEIEEVTPTPSELANDVTATDAVSFALGTRADDVTVVTDIPDVTTEAGYDKYSAEGPFTLDRKSNMILDDDEHTTTDGNALGTTEPTDDRNFNDILKEAEAAFAKLSEQ
ncbi:hypothetical protein HPB49_025020 [Dermacentor silvarum]|uniref:Uncharacterized protein n=1 Tax=Dermacentor silvarum TaxID=543639 RepID=A0ACB8CIN4_DERSI|nr:hypothetical protein HPB49_025020 [Dermacentor silvarum]